MAWSVNYILARIPSYFEAGLSTIQPLLADCCIYRVSCSMTGGGAFLNHTVPHSSNFYFPAPHPLPRTLPSDPLLARYPNLAMENNEQSLPPKDNPTPESTNSSPIENGLIGRNGKGQFLPGSVPNPNGRPAGSRNRACLLARAMLEESAAALTAKVLAEALKGNPIAYKLCMERLVPIPNDAPVHFPLPATAGKSDKNTADQLFEAHNALIQSVAAGRRHTARSAGRLPATGSPPPHLGRARSPAPPRSCGQTPR